MKIKYFLSSLFLLGMTTGSMAQQVNIIPYPQEVEVTDELCKLENIHKIYYGGYDNLENAAQLLYDKLGELGIKTTILEDQKGKDGITLRLLKTKTQPESYELRVNKHNIDIAAADYAGIIHGIQSLLQEYRSGSVKCGIINDQPRYSWRGYMLDEARHFQGEKKVKQLLDVLSYYKLNRFHWHLTDAPGWRIEIKRYPKLTQIGAIGNHSDSQAPATFYTQEQIKDIVQYAAVRGIEIVPEIDMPGHASASNRSYPEYMAKGTDKYPDWCFNPGKEATYIYLRNILDEITRLFPFKYIHIGGDEVAFSSSAWKDDEDIKKLMREQRLQTPRDVEMYFIKRMIRTVNSLDRIAMVWDDAYERNLRPEGCAITWWRHDKKDKVGKMAESGFPLILCPRKPLYFDFVQHDRDKVGRRWDGFCPLEDVYAFPESKYEEWGVGEEELRTVLGMQANVWGELVHNSDRVDYMSFPRIIAMAETSWTKPEQKDYDSFLKRLENAYKYMDGLGIYYFDARNPEAHKEPAGPVMVKH